MYSAPCTPPFRRSFGFDLHVLRELGFVPRPDAKANRHAGERQRVLVHPLGGRFEAFGVDPEQVRHALGVGRHAAHPPVICAPCTVQGPWVTASVFG